MRAGHKKVNMTKGKLYGIGIGPGDPKLLTLKARDVLNQVDIIFVPKSDDHRESCARSIIETTVSGKGDFVELTFPMTRNKKILKAYWQKAARKIAREVRKNKNVAFVTIGDPFIFSTYIYLLKTLRRDFPDIDVETIPGVSSFNAAAASAQFPLIEGDERLAVLPVTNDLKGLRETLTRFDTVVLMKVASKLDKVVCLLKEVKLIKSSVLVTHVGYSNQLIIRDLSSVKDKKLGYLSVIIVKRKNRS